MDAKGFFEHTPNLIRALCMKSPTMEAESSLFLPLDQVIPGGEFHVAVVTSVDQKKANHLTSDNLK